VAGQPELAREASELAAQGIPAWGAAAQVEEPEGFKEMRFIQAEEKILPTAKELRKRRVDFGETTN
jgi:hypothetical protein